MDAILSLEERRELLLQDNVTDLGLGYDHEHYNEEIAAGKYMARLVIAHVNSGINADLFYE